MNASVTFAKAIADETRQTIMSILCCNWMTVGDVVNQLGGNISQPTVSHHLKILNEAGLLNRRKEGTTIYNSLNQDAFYACCGQLVANFAPERVGINEIEVVQ